LQTHGLYRKIHEEEEVAEYEKQDPARYPDYFTNNDPKPRKIASQTNPLIKKNRNPIIPMRLIQNFALFMIPLSIVTKIGG